MRLGGEIVHFVLLLALWVCIARRFTKTDELIERIGFGIMAQVSIEQDDLDSVAATLEALVDAITKIDTSKLPPADQSKLQTALSDVTAAVNAKLPVTVPDGDTAVETPAEPEPEPEDGE